MNIFSGSKEIQYLKKQHEEFKFNKNSINSIDIFLGSNGF